MKRFIKKIISITIIILLLFNAKSQNIEITKEIPNQNIIGKIIIPGTNINEDITQYKNNEYYLTHDINGNYDPKGTIFIDYRNDINDKVLLIYGHNSHTYNIPFKELENYYNEDYYNEHKKIYISTNNTLKEYEIFSIFIEYKDWSYTKIKFEDDKYLEHLNYLKNKSWYESNITLSKEDNIIILQTCSYHKDYKKYKNKYLLIIAKEMI